MQDKEYKYKHEWKEGLEPVNCRECANLKWCPISELTRDYPNNYVGCSGCINYKEEEA